MKKYINPKFLRFLVSLSVLCAFMVFAVPIEASTLSAAQYMRPIEITNAGAETSNNAVVFDPDTLSMLTNGFINSSLTGSAITDLSNKDLTYMPKEPVRYKLVQYLESNGTQYIDTGYIPTVNTTWVTECMFLGTGGSFQTMGVYGADSSHVVRFYYNTSNSTFGYNFGSSAGATLGTTNTNWNTFIIDGKRLQASRSGTSVAITSNSNMPTGTIYLFAQNATSMNASTCRLRTCQIYDNGNLVRDYVPVQRSTDGVLGLLDRVNNVFYPNNGTGTFTTAQYPNDCYVCDYISTNGTNGAYVNTGAVPSANENVSISFSLNNNTGGRSVMGMGNADNTVQPFFDLVWVQNTANIRIYNRNVSSDIITYDINTRYDVSIRTTGNTNTSILYNGVFTTLTGSNVTTTNPIYLFEAYPTSSYTPANSNIYFFQHMNNLTIDHQLIPCYVSNSLKARFVDITTGTFKDVTDGTATYKLSGVDGNWVVYLPTVAANTTISDRLYISTENLNSKITYFPGETGMVVNRATSNTVTGSDDWKFSVKGQAISGDGSYLFKYSDNLYATMSGNTITFAYGTITIPIGTYNHNTNWLYYWGTTGTTFTGSTSISYQTNYMQTSRTTSYNNWDTYIRTSSAVSGYNTLIVRGTDDSTNSKITQYAGTGSGALANTSQALTDNALNLITISTGSVYPNVTTRITSGSETITNRIYLMAVAKADNPAQYSTLSKYGQDATAILSRASEMLNDVAAVITLTTKCTGDFMWRCIKTTAFTTALNSSPYKSIITSSADWAKALAWNTGSYSTTTPTGTSVALTATQQVPVGYHTYDFRKEGNAVSIYVDNKVVRGGIFNETSYYTAITSLGYTYSQLVNYNASPQFTFAESGVILFADEIQQTKNSTSVGQWKWTQTDTFTFPDLSPSGNTGYPSFRNTSYGSVNNGANISISFGTYSPANVAQYIPPGSEDDSDFEGLTPSENQPNQNVNIDNIRNIPFAEVFEDILAAGGIPSQLFWLPLIMILAIAAMMVTYHFTRDALIACIAGDVIIGLGIALSVLYTVPLVMGIITSLVLLVKRKTISL